MCPECVIELFRILLKLMQNYCLTCIQIIAESLQVLNKVGLALPFLVTLADDNKEMPSEEVRLRYD